MTTPATIAGDGRILPFLYVRDWAAAKSFYEGLLGLGWDVMTPGWVMVRGQSGSVCALVAEESRYDTTPPHRAGVFILVPDRLENRVAALADRGATVVRPVRRFSHGAEAAIADPDGNVLVLYETAVAF